MLHLERSGHSPSAAGYILAINGIMIVTLEMLLAASTRRLAARTMLAIGYIMMGGSFLVLLGTSPLWSFVLAIVVFTIGEMFAFSRQQAYAASLAPDEMRGRYSGFLSFAWAIGGIASSAGGLLLYDTSPAAVWILSAVLGLVGAAVLFLVPVKKAGL
jgi:predicted MFS family arabinose efflux permease